MLALLLLLSAAGILATWQAWQRAEPGSAGDAQFQSYLDRIFERKAAPPSRLVYPYSVIPGGVASPEEVVEAARRDPVVARHYAGFNARRARTVTLQKPRLAYVSYRIRDNVYFTKKPVRLFAGEQLITDGATTIRARCGNKVEEAPQMAVSAEEPPEEVLNTPKLESEPERAATLGAPRLSPVTPEEETPLAAVVPPAGFTPLDMPARSASGIWLTPPPVIGGFIPPGAAPGPGGAPPAAPPPSPAPDPSTPPTSPPATPPPVTPPPVTPPGAPPPATPPSTPPGPPVTPPPSVPPGPPPVTPPETPPAPPVQPPPAGPPATPPSIAPPAPQPPAGGEIPPPGPLPPPGSPVPPPGPLPPPILPPPSADPDAPTSLPPPDIPVPPPDPAGPPGIPEPEPIPEPSSYVLVGVGLLMLPMLRARQRR